MNKLITILLGYLLIMSCQQAKYSKSFLKEYVYEGTSEKYVIVPTNQNQYTCIYNDVLRQVIYIEYYQEIYNDYLTFLYTLFNAPQEINIIQYINREDVFDITHSAVWDDYNKIGIKSFMKKYIEQDNYGNYKSKLSKRPHILVIAKIMFDNGYFISISDYNGEFYFSEEAGIIILEDE